MSDDGFRNKGRLDSVTFKCVAAKASPCVVSLVSLNVPGDMIDIVKSYNDNKEYKFIAYGTIIECEEAGTKYLSTILTCATLFVRTNGVHPSDIKVDVFLAGGKLYKGQVVACDFHYNLAAVRIQSDFPLRTGTLRDLDDILSIDPTELLQLYDEEKPFQLRRHSDKFKILPGARIIALGRGYEGTYDLVVGTGIFCTQLHEVACRELYWIKNLSRRCNGGPVINCCGEVIGVEVSDDAFLPSNIVSRWWKHYKTHREFHRPWLGLEVSNLHESEICLQFLEQFVKKFPNISKGVIVEKVVEDSPSWCSGIRPKDVIVECDGKLVRSVLEFFEKVWDKAGESVEINVLRTSDGSQFKVSLTIGETTADKFYQWKLPFWRSL